MVVNGYNGQDLPTLSKAQHSCCLEIDRIYGCNWALGPLHWYWFVLGDFYRSGAQINVV